MARRGGVVAEVYIDWSRLVLDAALSRPRPGIWAFTAGAAFARVDDGAHKRRRIKMGWVCSFTWND